MRAAINTEYGTPDVLSIGEIERPALGAREILVEVRASAVTQGDRRLRAADFPGMSAVFGRLMTGVLRPRHTVGGSMFAGRVVEVGDAVTRYRVGDDVYGSLMHGAYAQYVGVAEDGPVARMPRNLDYAEAAAIPYGGGTGLAFLRDLAAVQPGERVLVVGASGGVGHMAVQIAKQLGAEVTGVCSRNAEELRELGVDHIINHRHSDFATSGQQWDVILDTTEGDHFRRFRQALTSKGRYLSLYMTVRVLAQMGITALRGGPRAIAGVALPSAELLEDLTKLVEAGDLRPVIAARYPLSQIAEAHAHIERERIWGTLAVDVAEAETEAGRRRSPLAAA